MAILWNRSNNMIYNGDHATPYNERPDIVELDEPIADIIRDMNAMGFETKFSCSGHIYPDTSADTIFVKNSVEETIKEIEQDLKNENMIMMNVDTVFNDTAIVVMYKYWSAPYIMFANDYPLQDKFIQMLSDNWTVEGYVCGGASYIIRRKRDDSEYISSLSLRERRNYIDDCMDELRQWISDCKNLIIREKEISTFNSSLDEAIKKGEREQ